MTNNIIIPYLKDLSNYTFRNYFSLDCEKIKNLKIFHNKDYIKWVKIPETSTLDYVSYSLYGTADYWDLLMIINGINPIEDLPKNQDALEKIVDKKIEKYFYKDYFGPKTTKLIEEKREMFLEQENIKNEASRIIKVVRPEKIQAIINEIQLEGLYWK